MKKLSTVIIILILEIVFHNMNYVNAQPDPKLDWYVNNFLDSFHV